MTSSYSTRLLASLVVLFVVGCGPSEPDRFTVLRSFPHDQNAYTQGLLYHNGFLYESTGRRGQSTVRKLDPANGNILARATLPADRFGEGLVLLDSLLYQLTWQSGVAYVYDVETLGLVDSFVYEGEGWGLTTDGTHLLMTDGTAALKTVNPTDFTIVSEVTVTDQGSPLTQLNELEFVDGFVYANVYQSDWIVRIDPATGNVLEWIDLHNLMPPQRRHPSMDVLNGIAYNPDTGTFFLTGKLWPEMYEVTLGAPTTSGAR